MQHAKSAPSRPVVLAAKILASVFSVAAVSAMAIAAIVAAQLTGNVQAHTVHLVQPAAVGHPHASSPAVAPLTGAFDVMLVGSDTRTGQGAQFSDSADQAASSGVGNNDVNMMLHVNAAHTAATVISFPRDTILPIPDCPATGGGTYSAESDAMLNTTLSRGGLSCPVLTVEKLLGIDDIDYAAEISFDGVAAMSDAVGGVPVCVATAIKDPYTGLDLPAGMNTIEGPTALAFLRTRHGMAAGSDLARISNQQNFMSALLRTITSKGTLSNPLTLYKLATAATTHMTLSDTLSDPKTMVGMALALKGIPLSRITFVQYPVVPDPQDPAQVLPDATEGPILASAIQHDEPIALSASTGSGTELATAPAASPAHSAAPGASAPTRTAPPTPEVSGGAAGAVTLGQNATGQTAAQETCTRGVIG